MTRQPLFGGLIVDEQDHPVGTAFVGAEPCYVVDDDGFRRHIASEQVDRQVLKLMRQQIDGNEDALSEAAAMLENQLKNIDQQFETLLENGIPEDGRAYMGMLGFKVVINVHGEVVRLDQPAAADDGGDGEE